MGQNILLLLSLFGCIALFLYGMRVMSQGVLKIAGPRMRASLRSVSPSNLRSFGIGAWITSLMQSSSAMTVMTVSLVNAGLLTLSQSIAIIMGANVGTTITAWMIVLWGYWLPLGGYAIPAIALAIPFLFSGRVKRKPWGESLIGASLLILGFSTFINQFAGPEVSAIMQPMLAQLSAGGFWSVLLFVLGGILFTMFFQSSAATLMLALVFCAQGWIAFPMAAAMVIGDNVGTTLTALMAARKTNISARRASYAHLIFNLIGLVWSLVFIYPLSAAMLSLTSIGGTSTPTSLALAVALYHTGFNLLTSLLLIGFIPSFDKLLCVLLPIDDNDDEEFHLRFIHGGLLSTSELALVEARKESVLFGDRVQRMLQITIDFIHMPVDGEAHSHTFSRIEKYEKITDRLEMEIVRYLNNLDSSNISGHAAASVRSLFKTVDELESIGDSCYNLARDIVRRRDAGIAFTDHQQTCIDRMLVLTRAAMSQMVTFMHQSIITHEDMEAAYRQEHEVNTLRNQLREENIGNVQRGDYTYTSGIIYMDIVSESEKLCDFIINVLEALSERENTHSAA